MNRCPVFSSVSPEQCRELEGHPCYSPSRFHRFTGCELKGWCCLAYDHEGDCMTVDDRAHFEANPAGCGNRSCFTCVHIVHTMLPEGMSLEFPLPRAISLASETERGR